MPFAMITQASFRLVHTPGLSANWARQGMRGGENKPDPRDAATIAELVRTRPGLRLVDTEREIDVDIRLPVGRGGEIARDHTRRLGGGVRDLFFSLFPAFQRWTDVKTKTGLTFLSFFAAPHELRTIWQASVVKKSHVTGNPLARCCANG